MAAEQGGAGNALWAILAEIDRASEARYLAWFHDVHIPEKLSRPGYLWAAHYRMQPGDAGDIYLALFGGIDTRSFLAPSPAQLKTRQDARTREMMQSRVRPQGLVLAVEWQVSASPEAFAPAPFAALTLLDAPDGDDAHGAGLVQQTLPRLRTEPGILSVTKYLAAIGTTRHVLHVGFADGRALAGHAPPPGRTYAGRRVA